MQILGAGRIRSERLAGSPGCTRAGDNPARAFLWGCGDSPRLCGRAQVWEGVKGGSVRPPLFHSKNFAGACRN